MLIGRALAELGRPVEEVATRYARALETDPRHGDLDRLALLRFRQQRYEEALELYRVQLDVNPDSSQLHSNIGAALYFLNREEAALASFERALQLDPDNEVAQRNLRQIRQVPGRDPGPE